MKTGFGSVITSHLNVRSKFLPSWQLNRLWEGVVLNIVYPDDEDNITGCVECNVLLRDGGIVRHARILRYGSNKEEADEWLPRTSEVSEVEKVLKGQPFSLRKLGGELVVVGFLSGRIDYPVIIGSLEHPEGKLFTRKETKKRRRYLKWNNTEVYIDGDGNVVVNVPDDKTVSIKSSGKDIAVLKKGEIIFDPNSTGVTAGVITMQSIDPFTGQPHIDGSLVVKCSK